MSAALGVIIPPSLISKTRAEARFLKPRVPLVTVLPPKTEEAELPPAEPTTSKLWMLGVVLLAGGVGFYRGWSGA